MVVFECNCGFSCGTQKALWRHVARFPDGSHKRVLEPCELQSSVPLERHLFEDADPPKNVSPRVRSVSCGKEDSLPSSTQGDARTHIPLALLPAGASPVSRLKRLPLQASAASADELKPPDLPTQHVTGEPHVASTSSLPLGASPRKSPRLSRLSVLPSPRMVADTPRGSSARDSWVSGVLGRAPPASSSGRPSPREGVGPLPEDSIAMSPCSHKVSELRRAIEAACAAAAGRRDAPLLARSPPLRADAEVAARRGLRRSATVGTLAQTEASQTRRIATWEVHIPSPSGPRATGMQQHSSPQSSPRACRSRRDSSGLVLNPGLATVEFVEGSARKSRYSLKMGIQGEQVLLPLHLRQAAPQVCAHSREVTDEDRLRAPSKECKAGRKKANGDDDPFRHESTLALPHFSVAPSSQSTSELFTRYISADNVAIACITFAQLTQRCGAPTADERGEWPYRRLARLQGLPWRARSVWTLLDERARRQEYAGAPLAGRRAIVCGAGPCGLRAALELALLGAEVVVVEKRGEDDVFCRINRVHLWEWCVMDLLAWGAKIFDPPGGTFGGDTDFCHIGIGELQLLLMKSALLLGVEFRFEREAKGVEAGALICMNGERIPCDALLVADGANSALSRMLGLRSVATGLRGTGSAIGVVANFVNSRDPQQLSLRQFSWARQFNMPLFVKLREHTGIDLENIVYYKCWSHHYMVMTPTKRSLLQKGVLRDGRPDGLLRGSNVDIQQLSCMVRSIASFFGLPTLLCDSQGVMIFDFSGVKRLENAATTVDGVFVCAVGDALLEPFWPEGLGIVRGFHSALDAVAAVVIAARGETRAAMAQATATYNILKSVAAHSASQCLHKDMRQYRLAPRTRYIMSHA